MTRPGPLLSPILIGRDDLLDLADRRMAEAAEGCARFLLLAGEAGIGKSRLMSAMETRARQAGFRTVGGFLAPQDRDVPAASLLDMARSMRRMVAWGDLGGRLLELGDATVAAPLPDRRVLVFRAVDMLAGALDGPVMLAFDDLQWADALSLEILTELARAARDHPLFMVGAYRTDELAPGAALRQWRARLLTQRAAEEARLPPLSLEQTALMTTLILGTGLPAPRDVVAAVHERTDGVPLHIEELLGALAEHDRTSSRAIREASVPDTLEDAIRLRIGRLSPEAQAVARSGAVIGRCFVPGVLAGIMEVPPDSLDGPLAELVEEHVLEPAGQRGLYDFRHQVLRDVLYRTLGDGERRRLHARAGELGRELEGASEVHASVHFERAGLDAEAFRSALQGARLAARLSSHREALELIRRAVDHMPGELPLHEQGEIFQELSVEAAAVEEIDECERAADEARDRFARAGDPERAVDQLVTLANMARRRARPVSERLAGIAAAMAEVDTLPATERTALARAGLWIERAYAAIEAMNLVSAREAIEAGTSAAAAAGDETACLWIASLAGVLDAVEGHVTAGLDHLVEVAHEARERGFEDAGVTAFRDAAVVAARLLEYPRAGAAIDEGLRYADAVEQSHCAHVMAATAALVAWAEGRWDEAVSRGEHAVADRGCARAAGMARRPLGYVAMGRGDLDAARSHLEAAEAFAATAGAPDFELAAAWGLAELALLEGDHEAAAARSDRALELARRSGERAQFAPFAVTGVRARLAAAQPAGAERWLAVARELLSPVDAGSPSAGSAAEPSSFAAPALDHAAGLLRLAAGSPGAARPLLERANTGWDARPRTWESLWARLDLVACLLRSGRRADALPILGDVRREAARLESSPLLARVDELGQRLRRHDESVSAWHPLTAREFEVARLIASGMTNGEIALELSVSPRTVSAHVEHVLAKLGAGRRAEIASWVAGTAVAGAAAAGPARAGAAAVAGGSCADAGREPGRGGRPADDAEVERGRCGTLDARVDLVAPRPRSPPGSSAWLQPRSCSFALACVTRSRHGPMCAASHPGSPAHPEPEHGDARRRRVHRILADGQTGSALRATWLCRQPVLLMIRKGLRTPRTRFCGWLRRQGNTASAN